MWNFEKNLGLTSNLQDREMAAVFTKQVGALKISRELGGETEESKLEAFSGSVCSTWWGNNNAEFVVRNAEGRAGGIATVWNKEVFVASSSWNFKGATVVNGRWKQGYTACCLVNVYAPMDSKEKELLWERLGGIAEQNKDVCLCIAGDFNTIREPGERVGRSGSYGIQDSRKFDTFIRENDLVEIRCIGRKFTWYQPCGGSKSKLDRFLVNQEWIKTWPSSFGRGLQRSMSDHCPLLLSTIYRDWGPKPFRFINAWISHPDFKNLVQEVWEDSSVRGWSCFVFKEKLKLLKAALKEWNKKSFGMMENTIIDLKEELQKLDTIDDAFGLEVNDYIRRNEIRANIILQTKNKISLLHQKANVRWIKEGDLNSGFYHRTIAGRRKKNELGGLRVNNQWIDEPTAVKKEVKSLRSLTGK
ncbi:uncharacterized protein LOC131007895 [Salvia miltiorrhiza]|uniref:uncharacterized protein LOC131007895 n=1 Tax=Salvia miltiorrhiza TaxID=226208 RepID=UPI0025AC51A0|nr:uncharacterized protein LOC131007895 [Salvia miltiorrhiza]